MHPVPYTAMLAGVTLKEARDVADLQQRLREAAARSASHRPLLGFRFDDESLAERRLPTRDDIDAAVSDRPVLLKRYCGHIAVANSAALAAAGLDSFTLDPAGGSIDRDPNGDPNGILRETARVGTAVFDIVRRALRNERRVAGADAGPPGRPFEGYGSRENYISRRVTETGHGSAIEGTRVWCFVPENLSSFFTLPHCTPTRDLVKTKRLLLAAPARNR
ncbi:MAG: amidohydrolase family protein [Acidobacteria bacterium]|nr:amidohydrolase family protein [Candidatus Sulfomarinibacter sp. MAG AM2]